MGAVGVIVVDVTPGTSASKDQFFHMSGEQPDGSPPPEIIESLPCVFLFYEEGAALVSAMARRWRHEASPALVAISKNDDSPREFCPIWVNGIYGLLLLEANRGSRRSFLFAGRSISFKTVASLPGVLTAPKRNQFLTLDGIATNFLYLF